MNDSEFLKLSQTILTTLADALEPAYETGALEEVTLEDGVLTVLTQSRRTFVVSRHAPTHQVWLASPLSGGLHFIYDPAIARFKLNNGDYIEQALQRDLASCGIEVTL